MKNTTAVILLIVAFIGGFLLLYQNRSVEQKTPDTNQENQQTSAKQNWESKTDDQFAVTITVTPLDISPQSKQWKFGIIMDTHLVELDQDMIKIVVLVDDKGKKYKPTTWEGPVGGHHREGVLVFNAIEPMPKSIKLKISNIGDVIRNFTWQL